MHVRGANPRWGAGTTAERRAAVRHPARMPASRRCPEGFQGAPRGRARAEHAIPAAESTTNGWPLRADGMVSEHTSMGTARATAQQPGQANMERVVEDIMVNWLRVLDTTKCSQVDHRVCQQLHAIMPLLDAFKSEQQPLEFVLPRKGPLDPHA